MACGCFQRDKPPLPRGNVAPDRGCFRPRNAFRSWKGLPTVGFEVHQVPSPPNPGKTGRAYYPPINKGVTRPGPIRSSQKSCGALGCMARTMFQRHLFFPKVRLDAVGSRLAAIGEFHFKVNLYNPHLRTFTRTYTCCVFACAFVCKYCYCDSSTCHLYNLYSYLSDLDLNAP